MTLSTPLADRIGVAALTVTLVAVAWLPTLSGA